MKYVPNKHILYILDFYVYTTNNNLNYQNVELGDQQEVPSWLKFTCSRQKKRS